MRLRKPLRTTMCFPGWPAPPPAPGAAPSPSMPSAISTAWEAITPLSRTFSYRHRRSHRETVRRAGAGKGRNCASRAEAIAHSSSKSKLHLLAAYIAPTLVRTLVTLSLVQGQSQPARNRNVAQTDHHLGRPKRRVLPPSQTLGADKISVSRQQPFSEPNAASSMATFCQSDPINHPACHGRLPSASFLQNYLYRAILAKCGPKHSPGKSFTTSFRGPSGTLCQGLPRPRL